jgi:hypothetical protein
MTNLMSFPHRIPSSRLAVASPVGLFPIATSVIKAPLFRAALIAALAIGAGTLSGCGTTTGSRAGSSALFGAASGAALGSLSANAGAGALIGAGAGALGGYLYDQHQKGNID